MTKEKEKKENSTRAHIEEAGGRASKSTCHEYWVFQKKKTMHGCSFKERDRLSSVSFFASPPLPRFFLFPFASIVAT